MEPKIEPHPVIKLNTPLKLNLPPTGDFRLAQSERKLRFFLEYPISQEYPLHSLNYLRKEFRIAIDNPIYFRGHIRQMALHIILLEKFLKYPVTLRNEFGMSWRKN